MGSEKIQEILTGEPAYRKKQVYKLIFDELIEDWGKATILPKTLRAQLTKKVPLAINALPFASVDNRTIKTLVTLDDGLKIETVLMQYKNRNSVCVSSQVGCALGCSFCATGKIGFKRNLTAGEIIDQVVYFSRQLKHQRQRVNSIVFMGMGEPFLTYDNVLEAIKIINDKDGFNIGARHISISTAGIPEGINQFANESLDVNLALSLHAADNELRSELMPINRKYPLAQVMDAIKNYLKTKNRKVMIEYIMIGNVNDSNKHAKNVAKLLHDFRHLYHVNLIQYNPTGTFEPSTHERMQEFVQVLKEYGISSSERFRFGRDINASCGQLALKNKDN